MQPKGIRLNNPGNIERGAKWRGLAEKQLDPRFCTFDAPEYGIRALVVILRTYNRKYGLVSVRDLVARWAPQHENPTEAYIKNVANWTGVQPDAVLDFDSPELLAALAASFTRQENGFCPYSQETLLAGVALALQ